MPTSTDKLCKQFRPRSGLTKCRAGSGFKLFDGVPEIIFEKKDDFEKKSSDDITASKIT